VALEVLTRVRRDDAFANLLLPELLETADLDRRDAGFATALTYGTLRLQGRYDAMIAACTDRPLERIDPAVLDVLRLGAHQLMGMRVAQHAAVSTTVDLATTSCGRGAATFVNAVMRRLSGRDLDSWMDELRRDAPDKTAALARTQSHPEWIVKALRQALVTHGRSDEELEALLAADNADPEVALCARPGLIAPEALAKDARKADRVHDVEPRPGRISPLAVVMVGGDPGRIEAIRDCRAGVEDELVKAGAHAGDTVLIGEVDGGVLFTWEPTMTTGPELLGARGTDLRLETSRRRTNVERRSQYHEMMDAKEAARQQLRDEAAEGLWTDAASWHGDDED